MTNKVRNSGYHPAIKGALPSIITAGLLLFSINVPAQSESEKYRLLEEKLERTLLLVESLQREVDILKGNHSSRESSSRQENAPPVQADERLTEIEDRLEETEELVSVIDEKIGSRAVVNAFDAVDLNFGGFLDLASTHVEGADGSASSFNRQVFELLFSAELGEYWDLFAAQAFVRKTAPNFSDRRNPDFADINSVATDTVIAWANFRHKEWLNMQFGRFITPHGIINIEHFPALLLDPEQPQFLRPFTGQTIFPNFTDGIQMHGFWYLGDAGRNQLRYNLYTGNYAGNSTDFNFGARMAYDFAEAGFTLGANFSHGTRSDLVASDYVTYGFDLLYDKDSILWKNEVFLTDEDRGADRFAFYTQPAWRMGDRWTIFYRFDYLDAGREPLALVETGESIENALGITYRPNPNVHLRNVITHKSFESTQLLSAEEAWLWQVSATLSF